MSSDIELEAQARTLLREVVELAHSCPKGGDARWDAMLARLGVTGLPLAERQRHLAEGAPLAKGALPLELRWALEATIAPLEPRMENTGRLPALVDQELRGYLASVKPTISTSSIFANAMATSTAYTQAPGATGATTSTLSCPACGAPRRDGDESTTCQYCGTQMLT